MITDYILNLILTWTSPLPSFAAARIVSYPSTSTSVAVSLCVCIFCPVQFCMKETFVCKCTCLLVLPLSGPLDPLV